MAGGVLVAGAGVAGAAEADSLWVSSLSASAALLGAGVAGTGATLLSDSVVVVSVVVVWVVVTEPGAVVFCSVRAGVVCCGTVWASSCSAQASRAAGSKTNSRRDQRPDRADVRLEFVMAYLKVRVRAEKWRGGSPDSGVGTLAPT